MVYFDLISFLMALYFQTGFINLVSKDGKTITKITGLPKVDSRGQGGLLDIAIDPDFLTNKTIYWTF